MISTVRAGEIHSLPWMPPSINIVPFGDFFSKLEICERIKAINTVIETGRLCLLQADETAPLAYVVMRKTRSLCVGMFDFFF